MNAPSHPLRDGDGRVGPKRPAGGGRAVCSSQHPVVTETMVDIMRGGGTAADAAIAGSIVQAVVQQEMTNHTGTVTFLMYEAATGRLHELESAGTIVPGLAPFRRVPPGHGAFTAEGRAPMAVIPGFMPGMKAIHERFGTMPWRHLVDPAIRWAEEGHVVGGFEHFALAGSVDIYLYTESGRAHFTPNGHLPQVGDRWPKPELARTMRRLAEEGPDLFLTGEWARHFVARANELGWPITLAHLTAIPPEWKSGTRYRHRDVEIVQLSPPQRQAVFCAIVLGILEELGVPKLGHYTESPEALYYFAHALRRAGQECGLINDPKTHGSPAAALMSRESHRFFARVLHDSRPRADLTRHVELIAPPAGLAAAGLPVGAHEGSCELSIVDERGNWVQMMNTLQSGGIPGEVVDGVPMVGSHAELRMSSEIAGWLVGGGRMRRSLTNTIVLRDGKPFWSLGTPGNTYCTVPQVLSNVLDYGMDPYAAEDAPRMLPLEDDGRLKIESRVGPPIVRDLARLGVLVDPLPRYDWHMGSYQMSWRADDGTLRACAGPRRAGSAAAL